MSCTTVKVGGELRLFKKFLTKCVVNKLSALSLFASEAYRFIETLLQSYYEASINCTGDYVFFSRCFYDNQYKQPWEENSMIFFWHD